MKQILGRHQVPFHALGAGKGGRLAPSPHIPPVRKDAPQEPRSLGELTDEHIAGLTLWLSRKLGYRCDDKEIVQRALVKAFRGKAQYDPGRGTPLLYWLRQVVWSEAMDEIRRQRGTAVSLSQLEDREGNLKEELATIASQEPGPVEAYGRKQLRSTLGRMLRALPSRERFSVILHAMMGYSYSKTARRLGLTKAQVRRAFEKGLERLRGMYPEAGR